MENKPLVSILLLSMNHELFIEQSINSLIGQTYKYLEVIYLDNASADNTYQIGKSLLEASAISYKTFHNMQSKGISENLNFLIQNSKGQYLIPLSSDDWWREDNLEIKLTFLMNNPQYGMVYSDGYFYYSDGTTSLFSQQDKLYSGEILDELLKYNFIKAPSIMLNKFALNKVGLYDEKLLIEDWDLWIRIAEKFPIRFIDMPLVYYRYGHGGNLSSNQVFIVSAVEQMINKYNNKYPVEMRLLKKKNIIREAYYKSTKPFTVKEFFWLLKNVQLNTLYLKAFAKFLIWPRNEFKNHRLMKDRF